MKILHLVHQYPPEYIGGVELNTRLIARKQVELGHQVAVFYRSSREGIGVERGEGEDGVEVWAAHAGLVAPTRRFLATFYEPALEGLFQRVLNEVKPDIVHVQHLMGLPTGLVEMLHRQGIPFVITFHDFWWICANAQLLTNDREEICDGPEGWVNCGRCALARAGQGQRSWLAPALVPLFAYRHHRLRALIERAERILVPTAFTRDLYQRLGVPGERVEVVPYGILPPEGVEGAVRPPRPAGERAGLHIGYVGGISRQKGVHVLVEAVNQLPEGGTCLTIFGDTESFPDYAAELRQAASHPGIRFAGRIPNTELFERLPEFDVVVVPSIWYETAVIVIQEAFVARVPVIASALGALKERVRHEVDGLLVPPGDPVALRQSLLRLLREPELLPRLRAGIRPVVLIDQQAREIEAIYRRVVAGE